MLLIKRFKNIFLNKRLLWDMSLSQLKAKYAGSVLGLWWAVVTPLIIAISINFVFNLVSKTKIENYTIFALSGIIPWFFSVNALSEATVALTNNGPIIRQNIFPREILPISSILANFMNFLIGMLILLPLFITINVKVIILLPILFVVTILHFIFICGLGIIFSCLNVYLRDLSHFLATAFMGWFWLTPVFYSFEILEHPFDWVCVFNPMYHYIILYQNILFNCKMPSLQEFLISAALSIITFFLGYFYFLKNEPCLLKGI